MHKIVYFSFMNHIFLNMFLEILVKVIENQPKDASYQKTSRTQYKVFKLWQLLNQIAQFKRIVETYFSNNVTFENRDCHINEF